MKRMHFTEANVRALKTDGEYADDEVKYLRLYVTAGGTVKKWGIYKWIAARKCGVRRSLGDYIDLPVDDARKAAIAKYVGLKEDAKPAPKPAVTTLGAALAEYTRSLVLNKGKQPRWADETFRRKGVYDDWLERPMGDITAIELEGRQSKITKERGPAAATRALKGFRAVFAYAIRRRLYRGDNTGMDLKLVESEPRERVLNDRERGQVLAALETDEFKFTIWRPFFRLLLLTGVRWGNLAAANWKDIDLNAAIWTIPRSESKMKNIMRVRLRADAVELFREQVGKDKTWVFPSPKKSRTGHIVEPGYAWLRVLEAAGIEEHATPHDLRRTFGSVLLRGGAPLEVVKETLGHRNIQTTERHYAFMDDPTVRKYLDGISG
ncbi:site-specific integrase [Variovorax sp. OV084]|jgi:integrase|uniref:tyrosine-type recombinase/integrase n=1 Tax=Variovorax sp. OV084 TaxID=1882777 RepID=UPI0008C6DD92|nr:site-specific integrase [Variovorax sp. OV084]SET77983.1 Site-specific recombinase XerD [Variovorax sp. OV084]